MKKLKSIFHPRGVFRIRMSCTTVFRGSLAQRWIPCQSHKYLLSQAGTTRVDLRCNHSKTQSRTLGTFGRRTIYRSQHQGTTSISAISGYSLYNALPHYQQFSSSSVTLNKAATNELVTTVITTPTVPLAVDPASVNTSDVLETSAHGQWASDAALVSTGDDLSSLGLGGYSPIGLIQLSMEWIHLHTGMPWWASIITCTIILRTALLPIAIKMQANTARMNNIKPETEKLMAKIKHHNRFGQHNLTAIANKKLLDLYREHKCSPLKLALTPFVQIPIFISFFIALRRMAAAPVESMKTGGTLWFTDLTQHDPYYVLPFISCGLLLATIEMGGEAGVSNPQMEKMKTFFRAFTILLIPITAQFPTGLFMYWLPSSIYSIAQILLLKLPPVKSRLGIPDTITTPSHTKTAASSKGFFQMVKDNYRSANVDNEAKTKKASARKRYNQLLKDKSPKLYDKPPHLRQS